MAKRAAPEPTIGADAIVLSVRLKSRLFEGSIEIPLDATPAEREAFVMSWLAMMDAGIKCGQSAKRGVDA